MDYIIKNREPIAFFNFFEEIAAIPHGSGNEEQIASYLEGFAKARSLECYRDKLNNVLIVKPATYDKLDAPSILLQAHTDMVCEKLPNHPHDFQNDPLKLKVNGDKLTADGTTLGGDDGMGVAAMLYLLNANDISHPRLECLFTVSEETGMDGAVGFEYTRLTARRIINLDNEVEGVACCGCAGGMNIDTELQAELIPALEKKVEVKVYGLAGGHSGVDIDLGRQNAIVLLAKGLLSLYQFKPFCLISINGGAKPNVIPSSAAAVLSFFDNTDAKEASGYLSEYFKAAKNNFCRADKGFKYSFKNAKISNDSVNLDENNKMLAFSYRSTVKVLSYFASAPCGVLKYIPNDRTQVLSSVNLGVLSTNADIVHSVFFARSCDDREIFETASVIKGLTRLAEGKTIEGSLNAGWKYRLGGELQAAYSTACEKILGRKAKFENIHAGLECGTITASLNKIDGCERSDAISIGPTLTAIHSVNECADLASCERFCKLLAELLAML